MDSADAGTADEVEVSLVLVDVGQIVVRLGLVGVQRAGCRVVAQRCGAIAAAIVDVAQIGVRGGQAWIEREGLDWETLPPRLEAMIGERLERLPDALQEILRLASVEGEVFTAEALARVQKSDPGAMVRTHIDNNHHLPQDRATTCLWSDTDNGGTIPGSMLLPLSGSTCLEFQGIETVYVEHVEMIDGGCIEFRWIGGMAF